MPESNGSFWFQLVRAIASTSIHGFGELLFTNTALRYLFIIPSFAMLALIVLHGFICYLQFVEKPTFVKISLATSPDIFPVVTLCSLNPVGKQAYEKVMQAMEQQEQSSPPPQSVEYYDYELPDLLLEATTCVPVTTMSTSTSTSTTTTTSSAPTTTPATKRCGDVMRCPGECLPRSLNIRLRYNRCAFLVDYKGDKRLEDACGVYDESLRITGIPMTIVDDFWLTKLEGSGLFNDGGELLFGLHLSHLGFVYFDGESVTEKPETFVKKYDSSEHWANPPPWTPFTSYTILTKPKDDVKVQLWRKPKDNTSTKLLCEGFQSPHSFIPSTPPVQNNSVPPISQGGSDEMCREISKDDSFGNKSFDNAAHGYCFGKLRFTAPSIEEAQEDCRRLDAQLPQFPPRFPNLTNSGALYYFKEMAVFLGIYRNIDGVPRWCDGSEVDSEDLNRGGGGSVAVIAPTHDRIEWFTTPQPFQAATLCQRYRNKTRHDNREYHYCNFTVAKPDEVQDAPAETSQQQRCYPIDPVNITIPRISNDSMPAAAKLDLVKNTAKFADLIHQETAPIITECQVGRSDCSIDDFDQQYIIGTGMCYSYNKFRRITRGTGGELHALKVWGSVNTSDYMSSTDTAGVKIILHPAGMTLFPDMQGYTAPIGYLTTISSLYRPLTRLMMDRRPCVQSKTDVPVYFYESNYTVEGCMRSCEQRQYRRCGCSHPLLPKGKLQYCSTPMDFHCLNQTKQLLGQNFVSKYCKCPPPCNEVTYDDTTVTIQQLRGQATDIRVAVYLRSTVYFAHAEELEYPYIFILSNIGSTMGTALSISIISLFEIPFLLCLMCRKRSEVIQSYKFRNNTRALKKYFIKKAKKLALSKSKVKDAATEDDDSESDADEITFMESLTAKQKQAAEAMKSALSATWLENLSKVKIPDFDLHSNRRGSSLTQLIADQTAWPNLTPEEAAPKKKESVRNLATILKLEKGGGSDEENNNKRTIVKNILWNAERMRKQALQAAIDKVTNFVQNGPQKHSTEERRTVRFADEPPTSPQGETPGRSSSIADIAKSAMVAARRNSVVSHRNSIALEGKSIENSSSIADIAKGAMKTSRRKSNGDIEHSQRKRRSTYADLPPFLQGNLPHTSRKLAATTNHHTEALKRGQELNDEVKFKSIFG